MVTLSGHIDSYAQKHAAETVARRVKGVKAVAEEIEVRLPFDTKRSDEKIAAAAVERLSWNVSVAKDSVQVHVQDGWVTLTGEVDWWCQKDAAEQDIRPVASVVGVSNQTAVKPRVNTAILTDEITHALNRSWFFDPNDIHLNAAGGKVVLTGTVHSFHERQVAGRAAWSAAGATDVENDLMVV